MKTNVNHDLANITAARTISGAADVKYIVTPNAMPASQEGAPYLGRTRVAGSCSQDELAEDMVKGGCLMNKEEIIRVWNGLGAYLLARMPEAPRTFDLGFMRAWPVIGGTFPSSDAEFDPERNELYVAVAPSAEIRDALDGGTPTSANPATDLPSIGNVKQVGANDPNTIRSGEPFWILGRNLTIGNGDEHAELKLPGDGGTVEVALEAQTGDDGSQRIVGTLAHPVDACEGAVLTLWTHGLSPESSLLPVKSQKLTVLAGDEPVPMAQTSDGKCKIMSMDDEGSTTDFLYGSAWNVNGIGIYGDRAAPGGEWEIARCSVSVDGSDYTLAGNFNEDGTHGEISPLGGDTPARGTYHDIELSLVASRGTESETLTITLPTFIVE